MQKTGRACVVRVNMGACMMNIQEKSVHGLRAPRRSLALAAVLLTSSILSAPAFAADAPAEEKKEIVVQGSLGALPLKDVGTIFGFNKNLVETPRSASTISKEQMERFGATEIYDLMAQSPGVFTNSFFGVGGALDIRGTRVKSISAACAVWTIRATIPRRWARRTGSTSCAARPRRSMARPRPAAT
jgi:outer membrane receptor for monomeric catechols